MGKYTTKAPKSRASACRHCQAIKIWSWTFEGRRFTFYLRGPAPGCYPATWLQGFPFRVATSTPMHGASAKRYDPRGPWLGLQLQAITLLLSSTTSKAVLLFDSSAIVVPTTTCLDQPLSQSPLTMTGSGMLFPRDSPCSEYAFSAY